jgi:hypothetical protein
MTLKKGASIQKRPVLSPPGEGRLIAGPLANHAAALCPLLAKQTCRLSRGMSAFAGKADIGTTFRNVR